MWLQSNVHRVQHLLTQINVEITERLSKKYYMYSLLLLFEPLCPQYYFSLEKIDMMSVNFFIRSSSFWSSLKLFDHIQVFRVKQTLNVCVFLSHPSFWWESAHGNVLFSLKPLCVFSVSVELNRRVFQVRFINSRHSKLAVKLCGSFAQSVSLKCVCDSVQRH